MTEKRTKNRKYLSGVGIYLLAVIFGSGASFALATHWLEVSPGWLALLVGTVFSIVGASLGETVVEAIVLSLIVGIMVTALLLTGLEIAVLRAGIVPVATGLCVGMLVAGISKAMST